MVKILGGDEGPETNIVIPLYAEEKSKIVPGKISWAVLMTKTKGVETFMKTQMLDTSKTTTNLVDYVESINNQIERWIEGYEANNSPRLAWLGFQYHWKILRVWVPLQLRLAVEQVLYQKGEPWSSLVTGFKPVRVTQLGD